MTFHPSITTVFGTPYRKPNQRYVNLSPRRAHD